MINKRDLNKETERERAERDAKDKIAICNTYVVPVRCSECKHLTHHMYCCWNCGSSK